MPESSVYPLLSAPFIETIPCNTLAHYTAIVCSRTYYQDKLIYFDHTKAKMFGRDKAASLLQPLVDISQMYFIVLTLYLAPACTLTPYLFANEAAEYHVAYPNNRLQLNSVVKQLTLFNILSFWFSNCNVTQLDTLSSFICNKVTYGVLFLWWHKTDNLFYHGQVLYFSGCTLKSISCISLP